MSFILDALRKSDAERQRTATPGLADVRYATRRSRRNVWIPVLVLVLLANMLFMGLQWYRGAATPTPAAEPAAAPAPAGAEPTPPGPAPIRPLAREADANLPATERLAVTTPRTAPPPPAPVRSPPADTAPVEAVEPTLPRPKPASRIIEGEELPTAADLIAAGTLTMPSLNLDLHVYSDAATGRFVIINGRKYREGAELTEGPRVETITPDGVILSNQGRRFALTSQ